MLHSGMAYKVRIPVLAAVCQAGDQDIVSQELKNAIVNGNTLS